MSAAKKKRRSVVRAVELKQHALFATLSDEETQELVAALRVKRYRRNNSIYAAQDRPDCVFVLLKGVVKVTRLSQDGKERILYLVNAGETFGLVPLLRDADAGHNAVAMDSCVVGTVPADGFERLMTNPGFALATSKLIAERLATMEQCIHDTSFQDVRTRTARTLVRLARDYAKPGPDGIQILLRLTQQDIADMIGATREMTSLTLNDFKREGLITSRRQVIRVTDLDGLRQLSQ